MAAPRSNLSARISAVRAVVAVSLGEIIGGTAPIGRGTGAEGPFGQRLDPSQVTDRSQPGARVAARHGECNQRVWEGVCLGGAGRAGAAKAAARQRPLKRS